MHLNRSMLEFARFARFFGPVFLSLGAVLALARFGLGHPMPHSAVRTALDLSLVAWAMFLGALLLCAFLTSLVDPRDDPPTIDPGAAPLARH